MAKDLTPQQELFLEALFDEELNPSSDHTLAKEIAGYPPTTSVRSIMTAIKTSLQDDVQNYFLLNSPRAAKEIVNIMTNDNPIPGSEKVLAAAVQILDRGGVTKPEKQQVEVQHSIGVVLLPALEEPDEQKTINHSYEEKASQGAISTQATEANV
jgi:hypothetical protein